MITPIEAIVEEITQDGLGGARTLRGIMRNRIVGEGIAYANFVVAADYGITTNKGDGTTGLYIGVNYIF